jgi:hypothetical protein
MDRREDTSKKRNEMLEVIYHIGLRSDYVYSKDGEFYLLSQTRVFY